MVSVDELREHPSRAFASVGSTGIGELQRWCADHQCRFRGSGDGDVDRIRGPAWCDRQRHRANDVGGGARRRCHRAGTTLGNQLQGAGAGGGQRCSISFGQVGIGVAHPVLIDEFERGAGVDRRIALHVAIEPADGGTIDPRFVAGVGEAVAMTTAEPQHRDGNTGPLQQSIVGDSLIEREECVDGALNDQRGHGDLADEVARTALGEELHVFLREGAPRCCRPQPRQ